MSVIISEEKRNKLNEFVEDYKKIRVFARYGEMKSAEQEKS